MVKHNNSTLVGETSNIVTRDEALRLPVVVGDPLAGNNHSLMMRTLLFWLLLLQSISKLHLSGFF